MVYNGSVSEVEISQIETFVKLLRSLQVAIGSSQTSGGRERTTFKKLLKA